MKSLKPKKYPILYVCNEPQVSKSTDGVVSWCWHVVSLFGEPRCEEMFQAIQAENTAQEALELKKGKKKEREKETHLPSDSESSFLPFIIGLSIFFSFQSWRL